MPDDFSDFLSRLTNNAKGSLHHANMIAQGYNSSYIGTEHLLLGILAQLPSSGARILSDLGITLDRARVALNLAPVAVISNLSAKGLSETAKSSLRLGWLTAQAHHHDFLGTEHIVHSLVSQKNSRASVLLRDMGVDVDELLEQIEKFLSRLPDMGEDNETLAEKVMNRQQAVQKGVIGLFGLDLTAYARDGKLSPVIGRQAQEDRAIAILSRKTKSNPVFIGEPGVGKTAIVESIAQRIVREDVPDNMLDKRIIQLDIAGMIAGTKYRGEFEDRFKQVLAEVKKAGNIILFVDEIHLIVGAGSAEGTIDAANMLKPALARGEICMIGATTTDEYRKHIEKDSALSRRLQTVDVPEPSLFDMKKILKGLKSGYEKHHNIKISDEVIDEAISLSSRYISERFMPDKAVDVLDEAAAHVRTRKSKHPSQIRVLKREVLELDRKMEDAVQNEDYERAAIYKTHISQLKEKIKDQEKDLQKKTASILTIEDIAYATSIMSGVPVNKIQKSEAKALIDLDKQLSKYVIGQDEALRSVAKAIRRGRSGMSSANRPIGSFIFMGPTGVGKTELAKVIAREVFGSNKSLIKIDMSEFKQEHTTSRLVGAPAGYVGYEDSGQLTDKIRRQPYSVVLFDEIEKAHNSVFNLLLQILEDGRLTDAKGKIIDFSHTVIILTTNVGADKIIRKADIGFGKKTGSTESEIDDHKENSSLASAELRKIMRPELLNRFDDIITFKPLTKNEISKIFDNLIQDIQGRLDTKGIQLKIDSKLKRHLISLGYSHDYGARALRRTVEDKIGAVLADGLISGDFQKGSIVKVDLNKEGVFAHAEYEQ